jgi:NADH:ubiquinone oxidoreductase subunit F (NADH-binding)
MYRVLTRIVEGKATMDDLALLKAAAGQIEGHTICAFGEAAAWPVQGIPAALLARVRVLREPRSTSWCRSGPPHERGR